MKNCNVNCDCNIIMKYKNISNNYIFEISLNIVLEIHMVIILGFEYILLITMDRQKKNEWLLTNLCSMSFGRMIFFSFNFWFYFVRGLGEVI